MKLLGGIPVDRSGPKNMVQQLVDIFGEKDRLILAVPPSGTRSKRPYWKTGFYHIAHGASVPIATSFLDYGTKECGFGPPMVTTGDIEADFEKLRDLYGRCKGKFPENTNDIRLRAKD
jgi:1-acyl-sn-glycerol-3-phosphate acyltransferase